MNTMHLWIWLVGLIIVSFIAGFVARNWIVAALMGASWSLFALLAFPISK